jgi:ornithine cyclodeaminase
MPIRILNGSEIDALLPMAECIEVMAETMISLSQGGAQLPLRTILRLPKNRGAFGAMPAQLDRPDAFGLKAISVYPGNEGSRWDSHQGVVLLFEPEHGTLAAIMDASRITAIRTAAMSGLATRLLARDDAADLAILGSGVQACSHLDAMRTVRPIRRVRAWSRKRSSLEAFVSRSKEVGVEVEPMESALAAVDGADLICTVTGSKTPVLQGDWITPGAHINAVGASLPEARELDSATVARSRLFVDRRDSAVNEAGDFLIPLSEGVITEDHIVGEIGDVAAGTLPGRSSAEEITLFKSLGLAIQDVASAHWVHRKAVDQGMGQVVDLGGTRDAS